MIVFVILCVDVSIELDVVLDLGLPCMNGEALVHASYANVSGEREILVGTTVRPLSV